MTAHESDIILGIDLGTTNSLVALCDEQGPRTIADGQGRVLLPSVVRFEAGEDESVRTVVGHEAAARSVEFPTTTVSSVKRLMGRSVADAAADLPYLSYRVVEGEHNTARVWMPLMSPKCERAVPDRAPRASEGTGHPSATPDPSLARGAPSMEVPSMEAPSVGASSLSGRLVSPQEVSALILRELAAYAGEALDEPVRKAVVTVPAYFDDAQRQATRDAGRLAGLEVVRIVNEPTAAALAYGLGIGEQKDPRTVVVFDLGGGTFDVSVLRITPNPDPEATPDQPAFYQVLSTAGDTHLGGDDIDHALMRLLAEQMGEQLGLLPPPRPAGEGRGRGSSSETVVPHDILSGLDPSTRRALKQFAQAVKHKLSEEETASVRIEVADKGVFETAVTRTQLEGMMEEWIERAMGCCARALREAGLAHGSESRATGEAALDAVILVGGSTRIPLVRRRVAEFFGIEPYTALDPDRVVALGAAVQAGIMAGVTKGSLLLDVIPLSLGIETAGGAVAKLIVANSTVPARATERFTTSVDGQTSIKIHVLQGEREMVEDCRSLGVFDLRGLPPMPAGVPKLEVEFLVDAGGVLRVTATEQRTGKRAQLQVVPNHGLTREEVERIEAESFAHARDDMQQHRVVDLVVNSRLDLKWIGEQFDRHGEALEADSRAALAVKRERLLELVAAAEADWRSVDADELARAKQDLDTASVRLQEVAITASLRADRGQ
ncbi:Chaperone protein DnaK [hydrothermal vent metagenome]|uniref:Chaperone protein DnaK n=1 Tax=hydrothermal vent metagenome TaxID=652676 RepID=A0A3B1D6G2_9ZZZZ